SEGKRMEEFRNYWIKPVDKIGNGSFGTVERVAVYNKSKTISKEFARKHFSPRVQNSQELDEYKERFKREVIYQAECFHSNIVHICMYSLGEQPWFIMELAEESLADTLEKNSYLDSSQRLSYSDKLNILKMVLSGLNYLHKKGFLHRDIKPENILKYPNGEYKLSDFGLIKNLNSASTALTQIGQKMGTSQYMSPEILSGGDYSIQSDIFAIGVVMEEL
ncbi:serine/threonine-protein kinase, partial [Glaesserella parasuis]|uniref:serine/threonine-protein kinase n=1 Tax=Glaesserella parasuis TaxID=738 RepID=UPI001F1E207D